MHPLVNLAKSAVENYVKNGKIISPFKNLPEEFRKRKAGTFVTIKKDGELRGCIGTYLPTRKNIAEEVIHNAVAAATEDYRFGQIQEKELNLLSYEVYILNEPKPIKNAGELDPKKFGIIVKTAPKLGPDVVFDGHMPFKSGLLLPDLEGVDTPEQQISIACQKAGINPEAEKITVYKFTAEKYE